MAQSWSVTINPGPPGKASFDPDTYGAKPGDPLRVGNNDQVCWNNQTKEVHQPWPANSSFQPANSASGLVEPIPSNKSSDGYVVTNATVGQTIYYICKFHNEEHGIIEVVS